MNRTELEEKIRVESKDGKISCRQALKLAEGSGMVSRELGELLNELKIKVVSCQLGCFP